MSSLTPLPGWQIEMSQRLGLASGDCQFMKMISSDSQPFSLGLASTPPWFTSVNGQIDTQRQLPKKNLCCSSSLPFSVWRMIRESAAASKIYGEALENQKIFPFLLSEWRESFDGLPIFLWVTFTAIKHLCLVNVIILDESQWLVRN